VELATQYAEQSMDLTTPGSVAYGMASDVMSNLMSETGKVFEADIHALHACITSGDSDPDVHPSAFENHAQAYKAFVAEC